MIQETSKHPHTKNSDEIDLGHIFFGIMDHLKLIISITVLFTVGAIIYALFSTPIFQANALIQVEQKQSSAILQSLSQIIPNSQTQAEPEIALLQSRMILGKTVEDLNLQVVVRQKYFPIFGRGWSRLTGKEQGSVTISRLQFKRGHKDIGKINLKVIDKNHYLVEGNNYKVRGVVGEILNEREFSLVVENIEAPVGMGFNIFYVSKQQAINDLLNSFNVRDKGKDTGILILTLIGDDPDRIVVVLDSISRNYLEQNIDRKAAQDAKSLDFLDKELPQVRSALNRAEDALNTYRKQKDSIDLSLEAKSILDQTVNIESQLNELTFREAEISQLYTKDHPTYKALLEKRQTLTKERDRLNKNISAMPATQQEVARLSRDAESNRAIYMQLLNRQQELSISKSSALGNVRIIDNAVTEAKFVKPKKALIVIMGMLLGAFISVLLVLIRLSLCKGIQSPEQLEERGISVYSSVPHSDWLRGKNNLVIKNPQNKKVNVAQYNLLAVENPADLAIEAIRGLRTSLHFAMMESKNNLLMISGPSEGVGKTFISTNLARIISQSNKTVLYIDGDMRKGYSHKLFKTDLGAGLSDILSGRVSAEHAIKSISSIKIDFISRGEIPPNPSELLMHERLGGLLQWASKHYDLVIVDTPPILAVTDAAIIGRYVGTTLLVARFEATTAKEMEISIRRFEQSGVKIKGCILNGVVKKASSYYAYGYSDAYNYK